ncbi:hypothetical protein ACQKRQ_38285 [Paraburkholderia sp. NPDC080076]|uniref:hypothetical protein n=1 Tax=Paraburkholderia sp. NPDC080076 TaxID=3390605 RepID=UPI003CFEE807
MEVYELLERLANHEAGLYCERPCEVFYPGSPEGRDPLYSNVKVERIKAVLIGKELGKFRLPFKG